MILNKLQLRTLNTALYLAMEWEASVVDAHESEGAKPDKQTKAVIARCEREIAKFRKLQELIRSEIHTR